MKPETKFKMHVIGRLRTETDAWFFKVQQVALGGIPDIIGCWNGKFFAWELKSKCGKPSKLQLYILEKIKDAGGHTAVVYPENFEEELQCLIKFCSS